MITISRQDNGVLFTFENSDKYLYGNGSILVPFNSLSIVADESDMITLKKAASNDIFLSARYDTDLGYRSKDDAIDDLKDLLFAETGGGGGGSGVTPSEVQEMIDESISGKADTSAVTTVANDVTALSGQVATKVATSDFNAYSAATDARLAEDEEVTAAALNNLDENKQDALEYYSEDTTVNTATIHIENTDDGTVGEVYVDGASVDISALRTEEDEDNGSMVETHSDINGNNAGIAMSYEKLVDDEEAAHSYLNVNEGLISMEVMANEETTNVDVYSTGVTINGENVVTEDQLSGYQPILSAGTGIEISGNVISATGGGGATYSAGTNISIANDVISVDLPIEKKHFWNGDGIAIIGNTGSFSDAAYSMGIGVSNRISASRAFILGSYCHANAQYSVAFNANNIANAQFSLAANQNTTTNNVAEAAFGTYNNSVTGSTASGQTLFSVGNGTSSARHNAFEVRQNGDIYVNDGTNDVRLQDTILALGGLKLVKLTQAEYDALATKDSSTIYFITNVVS